jgi:MFS family permease
LLATTFVDELCSGIAPARVPDLARELGVSPTLAAGAIISAFHSLALFVETPLLAFADRGRVRIVATTSLLAIAAAMLLGALAPNGACLLVAMALYGPASGCALAASEGILVESRPLERERTMTWLTLAGVAGDLAVPLLFALLGQIGLGVRAEMSVGAGVALALAGIQWFSRELDRPMAAGTEDEDGTNDGPRPPLRALVEVVRSTPRLLLWSLAGSFIALLDEVLVAFSSVHLDLYTHASDDWRAAAITAWTLGAILGLVALDRVLEWATPRVVLLYASVLAAVALGLFAVTRAPIVAVTALTIVGASASTFHPIAKARAYASLPGRPAVVNAIAGLLVPIDAIAPLVLSAIAARGGSRAAIFGLLVAPVFLGALALRDRPSRQGTRG